MFITGDIHGTIDFRKLTPQNWPLGHTLTKKDYLICTGDFGLVWCENAKELDYRKALETYPWTTLFVDGNHENFSLLSRYSQTEMFGGQVSIISPSIIWLRRGEVYEIEGKKFFVFGGAESIDRNMRIPGQEWWPEEIPSMKEFDNAWKNLTKHNWKVDYVITHTAPFSEMKKFFKGYSNAGYITDKTTFMLEEIKKRIKFKHWYFGHLHMDMKIGKFTTLYNLIGRI